MNIKANLLDAQVRFTHALAVRDYLLSLPYWHSERRAGLDQAGLEVSVARRNLEVWKRRVGLIRGENDK